MIRGKYEFVIGVSAICMCLCSACGNTENNKDVIPVETGLFAEEQQVTEEPIIIRRASTEVETDTIEDETEESSSIERIDFADRTMVTYDVQEEVYSDGVINIRYPKLALMSDASVESIINESIKRSIVDSVDREDLISYEMTYEIATKGTGILSVVFKGYSNYKNSPYPVNVVKTLNIDMTNGKNLRLKDYADYDAVITSLETDSGYQVMNEGITLEDFSMFINNGYMTDYAITMLDYDIDTDNISMHPTGYSCIRDNRLVLFVETEHAMGDYVELLFETEL